MLVSNSKVEKTGFLIRKLVIRERIQIRWATSAVTFARLIKSRNWTTIRVMHCNAHNLFKHNEVISSFNDSVKKYSVFVLLNWLNIFVLLLLSHFLLFPSTHRHSHNKVSCLYFAILFHSQKHDDNDVACFGFEGNFRKFSLSCSSCAFQIVRLLLM